MENLDLARVRAGDRLVALNPLEFALEGAVVAEGTAINDLDRPIFAQDSPRQPHLAVAAAPDAAEQFVVGDSGRLGNERCGLCLPASRQNTRR